MQKLTLFIVGVLSIVVLSCGKPTEENLTEIKNGAYKVEVRSQEFHHSGIRNVDIRATDVVSTLSLPKMSSGPNAFEISEIQD